MAPEKMLFEFEDRASNGSSGFAIAYAILILAERQQALTASVERLGANGALMTGPGVLEMHTMKTEEAIGEIRDAILAVAQALRPED